MEKENIPIPNRRKRSVVVDIDNTLLIGGKLSRLFWRLASFFQRLGRRLQYADPSVISRLNQYNRVIVLTSRDRRDFAFTEGQLKTHGIRFDEIAFCPRKEVFTRWKIDFVNVLARDAPVDWIDDVVEDEFFATLKSNVSPAVETLKPSPISGGRSAREDRDLTGL